MIEITTQDKPENLTSKPTNSSIPMQSQTNGLGFQTTVTTTIPKSLVPNYPKEPNRSAPKMTVAPLQLPRNVSPKTSLPEKSPILPKSTPELQAQLKRPVINPSSTSALSASEERALMKQWQALNSSELADMEEKAIREKWQALHLATLVKKYGRNITKLRKPSTELRPQVRPDFQNRPQERPENERSPQIRPDIQTRQNQISPESQSLKQISPRLIERGISLTPAQNPASIARPQPQRNSAVNHNGQSDSQISPRLNQTRPQLNQTMPQLSQNGQVNQDITQLSQNGYHMVQKGPQINQNRQRCIQNGPQVIQTKPQMVHSRLQAIQKRQQWIQSGPQLKPRVHQVRPQIHQMASQPRPQPSPGVPIISQNQLQGSPRMNTNSPRLVQPRPQGSPGVPRQSRPMSPMVPLQQVGGPQNLWHNIPRPRAIAPITQQVQSNGVVLTPGLYNAQQQRLILFQNQYHQPGPKVLQQPPKMPQLLPLKTMISSQTKSDSQATTTNVTVPSKSTSDPESATQASSKLRLVRPWEKRRKSKEGETEVVNIDEDYDKDNNVNEEGTDEQEHIPLKKRRLIMYELDTNYSHIKFGNCL